MDSKTRQETKWVGRAQGITEFAMVLPVLMLVMFGLIEFGRLMFIYSAATSAGREAARYGSAVGFGPNGVPFYSDCIGMKDAALRVGELVGVDAGDVYIYYDKGPGSTAPVGGWPACPYPDNPATSEVEKPQLGERLVVEVRGEYNPVPAAPFVNLPTWEFFTVTRRTIVINVTISQSTAVGSVFTPTLVPSPTNTDAPTPTKTLTPTNTVSPTISPTFTATPVPPEPPVYVGVSYTQTSGGKCNDIILTWGPNSAWTSYPGSSPLEYQTFKNGISSGPVSPGDPGNTTWNTGTQLNNNATIAYTIQAVFSGGLGSRVLTRSYYCNNGILQDTSATKPVFIQIVVPANGASITLPGQTSFEARAYDPEVGTTNGDGIAEVQFELYDNNGIRIMSRSEYQVRFCAFGGNSSCDQWNNQPAVGWSSAPAGTYTLRARAIAADGRSSAWVTVSFTIVK